jgi:hypothetical protein
MQFCQDGHPDDMHIDFERSLTSAAFSKRIAAA